MNLLHAILVHVKPYSDQVSDPYEAADELREEARQAAMNGTSKYGGGHVFDTRTEEDAGRWSDNFPHQGVVLGLVEQEQFLTFFEKYSSMPFKHAIETMERSQYVNTAWRTEDEINEGDDLEIIPNPANGEEGVDGISVYFSGTKNPEILFDQEFLQKVWDGEMDDFYAYLLKKSLKYATGEYLFDSSFYSLPDDAAKVSKETLQDVQANPHHYA